MKDLELEEYANRLYPNSGYNEELYTDLGTYDRGLFLEGAYYMMSKMYSKEDMRLAFNKGLELGLVSIEDEKIWEQFINSFKIK